VDSFGFRLLECGFEVCTNSRTSDLSIRLYSSTDLKIFTLIGRILVGRDIKATVGSNFKVCAGWEADPVGRSVELDLEVPGNDRHAFGRIGAEVIGALGDDAHAEFATVTFACHGLNGSVEIRVVLDWHDW
jgi:hypothetical protein